MVTGILAAIAAALGVAAQFIPITNHATLVTAVVSPYLLFGAPLAAVLLAFARRWIPTAAAVVLVGVVVATQVRLFIPEQAAPYAVPLRIMTANIYLGQADTTALASSAKSRADLLSVQELTPEAARHLHDAGLDAEFPFRALDARAGANGGGLWSRYPIVEEQRYDGYKLAMVSARVHVPGVPVDPTVVVAHMSGPWPQPIDDWVADLQQMRGTLQHVRSMNAGGCVIVAGDFNSTVAMRPFRTMLGSDFRDAAQQSGAGYTLTYPGDSRWIPAFMAIDHVLTSGCTATAVNVVSLPGSDHRGLVASVSLPAG